MSWYAGNGQPTYGLAFNTADVASLPTGNGNMSSIADIGNATIGDQFASLSFSFVIPTKTFAASDGAAVSFYCYPTNQDGTTYGDGSYSPISGHVVAIPAAPIVPYGANAPLTGNAVTLLVGTIPRIVLPAYNFRFVIYNSLNVTITSGTVKYFTYN